MGDFNAEESNPSIHYTHIQYVQVLQVVDHMMNINIL